MNIHRVTFDADKATEAAAVLLHCTSTHAMSRLRLMKLLYIANRKMLQKYGRPLFRCTMSAMKHGPVPSEVLTSVRTGYGNPSWNECFQNDGYEIRMIKRPDSRLLSEAEIEILSETSDELGSMNDWEVVDVTHDFPEWTKNYQNQSENTSRPIPLEDILEAIGMAEEAEHILDEMQSREDFDRLFSS